MNSRSFWVKGNRDDYAHFLARSHNANLLDVSSPFRFEIKSRELSSLILRRVSVWGQCSNSYHLQDAFIGLMIALPGSGFSTRAPGQVDLKTCDHHSIHWHFASDEQVYSHHLDSNVLYIRIETARFLRLLACKGLDISDIMALHGREASAGLIRLCEQIELIIETSASPKEQDQWADQFLNKLVDNLQLMSYLKASKFSRSSGTHVAASLQWICNQNSAAAINLDQLARARNVTPRTLQTSFHYQFKMTPIRWLKLWRISELHRLLFLNQGQHHNSNTLTQESGLGSITTANKAYRTIYGKSPQEELTLTNLTENKSTEISGNKCCKVYSVDEALELLSDIKKTPQDQAQHDPIITLIVKISQQSKASLD
jgi:AraC-like DNA-binding protein